MIHDEIGEVLKRYVLFTGSAPGASAAVAAFRGGRWCTAAGTAGVYSPRDPRPVTTETVYDLASLTKPVVACATARLARSGTLSWEQRLGKVLEAARGTASEQASLGLLGSHRAGLEAHLRLGTGREGPSSRTREWLARCANARRAECGGVLPEAGVAPLYSDLGYMLLGGALESVTSGALELLIQREVNAPLGAALGSARCWAERLGEPVFLARVAPTESVPERGGELRGVVHDDNAWELVGRGVAGHAGLFGRAEDVVRLGMALLDALAGRDESWLGQAQVEFLVSPRAGGSLRCGFDGKAETGSSAGDRFGARAFGHLGFTGTSIWCDPDAEVVVVLLTNRVCPTRENITLRGVRPDLHGELFGLAAGLRP
jgi:serine-type D-Ala-D-Ala carboxypeptidase